MRRKMVLLMSVALSITLASSASAELVARYSFDDGTANDSAFYYENADGTFFGDAHVIEDSNRGRVLDLDGSGDYVKILNTDVAEFSTESFSYAFWVKSSFAGDWYYFWKGSNVGGENLHGTNIWHDDDSPWVRFSLYRYDDDEGGENYKSRTDVPDTNCITGQWIHIAAVRDASINELRFYINGVLEPAGGGENPAVDEVLDVSNSGFLHIGCNDRGDPNPDPTYFIIGLMDDFRVYNHALTEEEVQNLASGPDPDAASEPSPEDGETDACQDVVLSWTAGEKAVTHDVYFGTDAATVGTATTSDGAVYRGSHASATYDAGSLETLAEGITYYWRVDEVNATTIWKGLVWSFTINDGSANHPDPADEATLIELDQIMSWSAGCDASQHKVYFGTNADDVNNGVGDTYKGTYALGVTSYSDPCGLSFSTDYYWRIEEVNRPTTWPGDLWHFRTKSPIVDETLRLWYKLDETEGDITADSSGREYDGEFHGAGSWDPDGYYDGCYLFTDDSSIVVPFDVLEDIGSAISITTWLKTPLASKDDNVVCGAGWEDSGTYVRLAVPDDDSDITWRAGNDSNDILTLDTGKTSSWKDTWKHVAVVKDESEGKMQIYVNGVLAQETSGASVGTLEGIRNRRFKVGAESENPSGYQGRIDDFRVYDKALTADEIAGIFRGGNVEYAWAPTPTDRETDVVRDVDLIWRSGDYAEQHDVYFGTDFDDVNDATTAVHLGVYKGRHLIDANSYIPSSDLILSTTYYWRIDEVNDPCVWKGTVWTFTVANFLVIDGFESYNTSTNEILSTWNEYVNAYFELSVPGDPVHPGGAQSALVLYYNDFNYGDGYESEVGRPLGGMDFTEAGVKALTLYFYGQSLNDAGTGDEPYVGIDDGSTYAESRYTDTGNPISDIQKEEWQEWNIAIDDLNAVTLNSVQNIYIGLGKRDGVVAGGIGEVYFDDIRLYVPRCVASERSAGFALLDFSDNCVIDYADVGIMAERWLVADACLPVATPSPGPVAYWELDDSGSIAFDSAGSNNGTLEGSVSWVAGRIGSGAAEFGSDDARIRVPHSAALMPDPAVSATAWIYPTASTSYTARVLAKGTDIGNWEAYYMQFSDEERASWTIRDPNHENHALDSDELALNEWIHVAGTYDGNALKLYINGQLDQEATSGGLGILQEDVNDLSIGNRSDGNDRAFVGKIDDVQIYDYALSATEVAYIATAPEHDGYVSLETRVNVYDEEPRGEKVVNLRDLAVLLNRWRDKEFWPSD